MRGNTKHLVFCVCVAFVLLSAFAGVASAKTIYVPDDYAKIQWAVDSASDGDTIIVRDGTYYENIIVNKRLTIKSENGSANCIVNGGGSWGKVFSLEADGIRIEGFTITGGSYGIYICSNNNSISNNNISNNGCGIYLYYSNRNSISINIISSNNGDGIELYCSNNNSISNNNISNNWYGINFGNSNNNCISNNNISNNWDGIYLYPGSNNNSISNNNISNNGGGIILYPDSNRNSISNNNISSNNWTGIYLYDSDKNGISNNKISNNDYGIELWYSNNNIIYLNNFINNTYNAYSYDSKNIWNSIEPIKYTYKGSTFTNYMGNYWSDYKGSDADEDGIGDTPYSIPYSIYSIDSDKDNYPLVQLFENYFPAPPSLTFTDLQPSTIITDQSTYDAVLFAKGTNFLNVIQIAFNWSGPDSGSTVWNKGDSSWNMRVTIHNDTAMTIRPRVLSGETGNQTKTWNWTVTLKDNTGTTASKQFIVIYSPTGAIARIDKNLLDLIDKNAGSYYNKNWNLTLNQFKAWIATIAWAEGMLGGYTAHSTGAPGSDVFYHKDMRDKFMFSTGIGPFQLDVHGKNWPTIEKLNITKALSDVLEWHFNKFPANSNLSEFANNSDWLAVNPKSGGRPEEYWKEVTGTEWDEYKDGKKELDWASVKSKIEINDPYEDYVEEIKNLKWKITEKDGITTDTGKKVIFDGNYPTWLITARNYKGEVLFKYYYAYNDSENANYEVWVWDNSGETDEFRYIFVRDYSTGRLPEHINGIYSGEKLEHPAFERLSEPSEQPILKAPWNGTKKITQGNYGEFSHNECYKRKIDPYNCKWENTYAIDVNLSYEYVLAPANGIVIYVDNNPGGGGGKELAINHTGSTGKNFTTVYLHLDEIYVKEGKYVRQGEAVAKSGSTGKVTGPHLHFHIWNSSGCIRYDSCTIPIERLVLKQVGVDSDFREYDARKGDLNDSEVAGKLFESNNIPIPSININVDKKVVKRGEKLGIIFKIINPTSQTQHLKIENEIRNSTGDLIFSKKKVVNLRAKYVLNKKISFTIPISLPLDTYTCSVILSDFNTGKELNRDCVKFTVIK